MSRVLSTVKKEKQDEERTEKLWCQIGNKEKMEMKVNNNLEQSLMGINLMF